VTSFTHSPSTKICRPSVSERRYSEPVLIGEMPYALLMRSTCRRVLRGPCDDRRAARAQAITGVRMLVLRPRSAFKTLRHWQ
jgi:hypothetical protein